MVPCVRERQGAGLQEPRLNWERIRLTAAGAREQSSSASQARRSPTDHQRILRPAPCESLFSSEQPRAGHRSLRDIARDRIKGRRGSSAVRRKRRAAPVVSRPSAGCSLFEALRAPVQRCTDSRDDICHDRLGQAPMRRRTAVVQRARDLGMDGSWCSQWPCRLHSSSWPSDDRRAR